MSVLSFLRDTCTPKGLVRLLGRSDLNSRMTIYMTALVLVLGSALFVLLAIVTRPPFMRDSLTTRLVTVMNSWQPNIESVADTTAAHAIRMSHLLSRIVDETLDARGLGLSGLNDNPEAIREIEDKARELAEQVMRSADCSGVFACFDATVNTSLDNSNLSRCGIYLRLLNVSGHRPAMPEFDWFRGVHDIAHERNLHVHPHWELEFDVGEVPFWNQFQLPTYPPLSNCYAWSDRVPLKDTQEGIVRLCVPIVGRGGDFYGVCGIEVSELYFRLSLPVSGGDSGPLTGLLSRQKDGMLMPSTGLESGTTNGWFADISASPLVTMYKDGELFRFRSASQEFVGLVRPVRLSPLDGDSPWSLAVLAPASIADRMRLVRLCGIFCICLVFCLLALVVSRRIGRHYVEPVAAGISSLRKGGGAKTDISEVDDLIDYLASREEKSADGVDMSGFRLFCDNIPKLSPAEKTVFNLYLKGYSPRRIAEELFISINTVKSHNRRIYMKLEISSHKELMLYGKMLAGAARGPQDGAAGSSAEHHAAR